MRMAYIGIADSDDRIRIYFKQKYQTKLIQFENINTDFVCLRRRNANLMFCAAISI